MKYIKFLKLYIKRHGKNPVSLKMLKTAMSINFNLSPEYCDKFVENAYRKGKL
jgi:hypothetical protein